MIKLSKKIFKSLCCYLHSTSGFRLSLDESPKYNSNKLWYTQVLLLVAFDFWYS